jgi:hypothetical protein
LGISFAQLHRNEEARKALTDAVGILSQVGSSSVKVAEDVLANLH